jgi:hypothetical protein
MQAFVAIARSTGLRSRRAQTSPLLILCCWMDGALLPNRRRARRNRRAPGASVGGKHGCDERLRSEQTCFSPAVGDRQIADCSAVNPRYRLSISVGSSLHYLRHLRDLRAKWATLRLFVSSHCVPSLCLCASVVQHVSGRAGRRRRARVGRGGRFHRVPNLPIVRTSRR